MPSRFFALAFALALVGSARAETPPTVAFHLASADAPLIIVPVMIGGEGPFQFVLDTGASMTVVSKAVAKKLKLTSSKNAVGQSADGDLRFRIGELPALAVGAARLEKLQVAIGDVGVIGAADGILGYNFLKQFRVTIDYKSQTIAFQP